MTKFPLQGTAVLITGAGSGIGRLLALGAATRGASRVVLWDLDADAAAAVADEVERLGARALAQRVDVTDEPAVAAAAREAEAFTGGIDVLVNNAGIITGRRFLDLEQAAVRRTFEVNTLALYTTTRAFLPGMLARHRGRIVTIASAAGLVGVAKQTDYAASKWAAIGFTESLRGELRAEGSAVTTLVVCPYYVSTGMFEGVQTRFPLLLPIQKPKRVAVQILKAIERGGSRLVTPWFAQTTLLVNALPPRLGDGLLDFFGINHGMDHFRGRR